MKYVTFPVDGPEKKVFREEPHLARCCTRRCGLCSGSISKRLPPTTPHPRVHHNHNVRSCRGKGSTLCNLCTCVCALKGILLERKLTVGQICRLFASFHGSTNRIIVTSWVGLFPTGFPQITAHTHTQTQEGFRNISFHLSLSLVADQNIYRSFALWAHVVDVCFPLISSSLVAPLPVISSINH